jgi:23S rRNA pseudouridine1911/1915/1917 synthase
VRTETSPPRDVSGRPPDRAWLVPAALNARALDRALHELAGLPWSKARSQITTGKIRVAGYVVTEPTSTVLAGDQLEVRYSEPRPETKLVAKLEGDLLVYVDKSVVVARKPAGISTVPFGDEPPGELTLDALVRQILTRRDSSRNQAPLGVVQRLDKATTGLLVFARTFAAKKHLSAQLRHHTLGRRYLALAHGDVPSQTFRSYLLKDRGDGYRGSAGVRPGEGRLAVTHVERIEPLPSATLVACRLETGRTHQIRIHLAEAGHPLLGDTVYGRDYRGVRVPAPRLMLHAAALEFVHPADLRPMFFEDSPPSDFTELLCSLRAAIRQ